MATEDDVIRKTVRVKYKDGLHARMAVKFLQMANSSNDTKVFVSKLADERKVTGKSLLGILSLGVCKGEKIVIEVSGADAEILADMLAELVQEEDFDQPSVGGENLILQ